MQSVGEKVVVLGTGGTIAGAAADAANNVGYTAAQIGVATLLDAVPAFRTGPRLEPEQVAQIDSKDMTFAVWLALARRAVHHLARPEVRGIVITHGTDTLEETAYFLHRVLAPVKPVVLTAAMRPASALSPDGPQNLFDAVRLAGLAGAQGVVVMLGGAVHSALDVRKVHTYRTDAFGSGDAGVLASMEEGRLRRHRPWPSDGDPKGAPGCDALVAIGVDRLPGDTARWPWVEVMTSHAGARAGSVEALVAAGVQGIVVAGTGNGSLHHVLEAALRAAQAAGVAVVRSSRCGDGAVIDRTDVQTGSATGASTGLPEDAGAAAASPGFPSAGALTPVKARIELMLTLMPGAAAG